MKCLGWRGETMTGPAPGRRRGTQHALEHPRRPRCAEPDLVTIRGRRPAPGRSEPEHAPIRRIREALDEYGLFARRIEGRGDGDVGERVLERGVFHLQDNSATSKRGAPRRRLQPHAQAPDSSRGAGAEHVQRERDQRHGEPGMERIT